MNKNYNCPKCGKVPLTTIECEKLDFNTPKYKHVCFNCGYVLGCDDEEKENMSETNATNAMKYECCPVCGQKLNKSVNDTIKECPNCNYKSVLYVGDLPNYNSFDGNSLVNNPDNKPGGLYGWICPKCGAVMSPYESYCPNCTRRNWEITCTSGTSGSSIAKGNLGDLGYNFEVGM